MSGGRLQHKKAVTRNCCRLGNSRLSYFGSSIHCSSPSRHTSCRVSPAMASRVVLMEEGVVEAVHASLIATRATPCVGLCIGKREVGARDFILELVPFPDGWDEGDDIDTTSATKSKPPASTDTPLHINPSMLLEHVTQVTRMLPGGLTVVGVYAFATENSFKHASHKLQRAAIDAADDSCDSRMGKQSGTEKSDCEQLIIHLSAENVQKRSVRRTKKSTLAHAPAPVEITSGKVLDSFVQATAMYETNYSLRVPLMTSKSGSHAPLRHYATQLLECETRRVRNAVVLLEGNVFDDEALCSSIPRAEPTGLDGDGDINPGGDASSSSTPFSLTAELLVPGTAPVLGGSNSSTTATTTSSDNQSDVLSITLRGSISVLSYAYSREPVKKLTDGLKLDLIRSLRARLDVLCDEVEHVEEEGKEHVLGENAESFTTSTSAPTVINLPRRAFVPWTKGLRLCDYLLAGETESEVKERCCEVLGMDVERGGVVVAEEEGVGGEIPMGATPKKTNDGKRMPNDDSKKETQGVALGKTQTSSSVVTYVVGAGVALLSAGLASLAMTPGECVGEMCKSVAGGA